MMMNKHAQEINIIGIIGGLIGGAISIIVTKNMGGGLILKLMSCALTGIVCYFVASKIGED